tara:strand:+ start:65 stop:274 length:210 start_codon:yes stop_codon:yes gene_type:complete
MRFKLDNDHRIINKVMIDIRQVFILSLLKLIFLYYLSFFINSVLHSSAELQTFSGFKYKAFLLMKQNIH